MSSNVTHLPKLTSMAKKVLRSINIGRNLAFNNSITGETRFVRARFEAGTTMTSCRKTMRNCSESSIQVEIRNTRADPTFLYS
jgi:hypothetical protein